MNRWASVTFTARGTVVGVPGEDLYGLQDVGAVHSLEGLGRGGLREVSEYVWQETFSSYSEQDASEGAQLGAAVFGRSYVPNEAWSLVVAASGDEGELLVGLFGQDYRMAINQSTPGVPGNAEAGDGFGAGMQSW